MRTVSKDLVLENYMAAVERVQVAEERLEAWENLALMELGMSSDQLQAAVKRAKAGDLAIEDPSAMVESTYLARAADWCHRHKQASYEVEDVFQGMRERYGSKINRRTVGATIQGNRTVFPKLIKDGELVRGRFAYADSDN